MPSRQDEICLVATDDTVLIHKDKALGANTLSNLDNSFAEHGVPRNKKKDVSLAGELTALGCDLSNKPALVEPSKEKITQCICRSLDVLFHGCASPQAFHSILGVWEWFALLNRPIFSVFDKVYDFVRKEPAKLKLQVPDGALNELLITVMLSPLFAVSLDREPLGFLVATDAAPEYGFGVSVCRCSSSESAQVCRLAERRGDYVRLCPSETIVEVSRLGQERRLKQKETDFSTVVSAKAKWKAHSGVLEANAYLLGLKWVARQASKHHHKVPFLVDAKVVVGAASKGRSSARGLRTCLRNAAAHSLAADLLPRIIYIPSESNPADRPSRGRPRHPPSSRPVRKTSGKTRQLAKLESYVASIAKAAKILKSWM